MYASLTAVLAAATDMASFGAAGLMGGMWLWERRSTRQREEQLTQAHERVLRDEQRLAKLTEVVEHNTAAIAKFNETQRETCETIKHLLEELHHVRNR